MVIQIAPLLLKSYTGKHNLNLEEQGFLTPHPTIILTQSQVAPDNHGPPPERDRVYPWWPPEKAKCFLQGPGSQRERGKGLSVLDQFLLTNSSKGRVRRWDNRSKSDYFYAFLRTAKNLICHKPIYTIISTIITLITPVSKNGLKL